MSTGGHTDLCILRDAVGGGWLRFTDPVAVVEAVCVGDVIPALRRVDEAVNGEGLHAAGFLAYEAAPAFDESLVTLPPGPFPLLRFGLYRRPERLARIPPSLAPSPDPSQAWAPDRAPAPLNWKPEIGRDEYDRSIARIRERIAAGDTYQVNYTFRMRSPFAGDPWSLFRRLTEVQDADHAAYIDAGPFVLCSVSPELFFRLDGDRLTAKPMKGTAPRGRSAAEDRLESVRLAASPKDRAENLMIVDMIRNDLGRIAETGTVRVPRLFEVERYRTVWQMTSTVTASSDVAFPEIVAALFPCASITGAPKASTMKIIAALERSPRCSYTGAIGYLSPGRRASFNVAIRTVLVDRQLGECEYGVGGGVLWDSTADGEYRECLVKARVLTERRLDIKLLETMLWTEREGYFLLHRHKERLRASAEYFEIPLEMTVVDLRLAEAAESISGREGREGRVRLLVDRTGDVRVESEPAPAGAAGPLRVAVAAEPLDREDLFLFHKTTNRTIYERARAAAPGFDDVILWNGEGEVTESCFANVVVEWEDRLVTPPVRCGLLAGTFRAELLERGGIHEEVIRVEDLAQCRRIWLVNSVRKWMEAEIDQSGITPDRFVLEAKGKDDSPGRGA